MIKKKNFMPYIFMLPSLILIGFIYVGPIIFTLFLSTTDWTGIGTNFNFIGFKNFIEIFTLKDLLKPLSNTFIFAIVALIFQNLIALILAIFINDNFKGRNFFRTVYFMPTIITTAAIGWVWRLIYNPFVGPINYFAKSFNIGWLSNIRWLADSRIVLYSIILVNVWEWFGWNMIIYLAGLQAIPQELYEVSSIDGASFFAKFKYITIPLLMPAITINIIMTTIGGLRIFDLPYIMTAGGPGHSSETFVMTIIRYTFGGNRVGFGGALSIILIILILAISIIQNRLLTRVEMGAE